MSEIESLKDDITRERVAYINMYNMYVEVNEKKEKLYKIINELLERILYLELEVERYEKRL